MNVLSWSRLALTVCVLASGCVSKPKPRGPALFCPPPPDEPRLQFLTVIGSSLDIEKENKFLSFLTGQREQPKAFMKPYGVTTEKGRILVCDSTGGAIEVIDLEKRKFDIWMPGGGGALLRPIDMAIDDSGTRYVADADRGQVVIFDAAGNCIGAVGDKATMKPTGVAVGGGRLYATNLKKSCVEVYDTATRKLLFSIPREGAEEDARMFAPTNIDLDSEMRLYVSDTAGFHLKVYDAEGKMIRKFGEVGTSYGQFVRPKGIAVDREHRIYNVDAATELVQIFDDKNQLLLFFGKGDDTHAPLVLPAGICIDYVNVDYFRRYADPAFELEYLVIVVSQLGEQNLVIYGFGHKK